MSGAMGAQQSGERRTDRPGDKEKGEEASADQHQESLTAHDSSQETPGELPQCRMGNRKVDDMSFMISCTNWY